MVGAVVVVGLLVLLLNLGSVGAFTTAVADRVSEVGVAGDSNALVELDLAPSVTIGDGDDDRGHGNDCDSHDEDNPSNSSGPPDRAQNNRNCGDDGGGSNANDEQFLVEVTNNLNGAATITVALSDGGDGTLSLGTGDRTVTHQGSGDQVRFDLPTGGTQRVTVAPTNAAGGDVAFEITAITAGGSTIQFDRSVPVTVDSSDSDDDDDDDDDAEDDDDDDDAEDDDDDDDEGGPPWWAG